MVHHTLHYTTHIQVLALLSENPRIISFQAATDPKYRELYDHAEIHSKQDAQVVDRVRKGEHVYIDWKTNLLFLMKREFLETGRCDFSLGTKPFSINSILSFLLLYIRLIVNSYVLQAWKNSLKNKLLW